MTLGLNRGLTSNKQKFYDLYYVDYIHTYIIDHNNPSVRFIDLVSHTTYAMCINFISEWRNLYFKVDSERLIFGETFHANFIYFQSFCQTSGERKSPKKYFLIFRFVVDN